MLDMYGFVLDMLSGLWTCIDEFEDLHVWIHVETKFDAEMWFICDIVVNICDEMWFIWYICDEMWFKCKKTEKKNKKNLPRFADGQHSAKLGLFYQHGPALPRAGLALGKVTSLC